MSPQQLLLLLPFLGGCFSGEQLRCYVCNSARDPNCADPFNPATIELADCSQWMPMGLARGEEFNATLCRKTSQRVSLGSKEDFRIVRSCGWEPDSLAIEDQDERDVNTPTGRCFNRAGTFEVLVTYCSCHGEGCNTSSRLVSMAPLFYFIYLLL